MKIVLGFLMIFILITSVVYANADGFEIKGKIIDKEKVLMKRLMDEGATWDGKFDPVGRRGIQIRIFSGNKKICEINPDENGAFCFKVKEPVTSIELEAGGGGFYLRKMGNWINDTTVDLVISKEGMFTLQGYVKNLNGKPASWVMVSAYDSKNRKLAYGYTYSKGDFEICSNKEIAYLKTRSDKQDITKKGPWRKNTKVDLGLERSKMFTLSGIVKDSDGNPFKKIRVISRDMKNKTLKTAMTDAEGKFSIKTDKEISSLMVYRDTGQELQKKGPWKNDSFVELVFQNKGMYTLEGHVKMKDGSPAFRASASIAGEDYFKKSTKTDEHGYYKFEIIKKIEVISFGYEKYQKYIEGNWGNNSVIDIVLDE
ncbi:MAG: carboxypeptidase regulatory-like domain-containing protein [Candidatus Aureabacteria bacterium]|nr:carboxypeptidase regulatory-like domain-containing protein [Candidatus Auribacterota bacterium]